MNPVWTPRTAVSNMKPVSQFDPGPLEGHVSPNSIPVSWKDPSLPYGPKKILVRYWSPKRTVVSPWAKVCQMNNDFQLLS